MYTMICLLASFYSELNQFGVTKAEALRQAQLFLLRSPNYRRPYYWAPFVLVCQTTNYNASNQTVIGGDGAAVVKAIAIAEQADAIKIVPLAVSGAFHTPLMRSAAKRLAGILATVKICVPHIPVISNVTGQPMIQAEYIRSLLIHQVTLPVRWVTSMQYLAAHGVDTFIEFGPGKT